MGRGATDRTGHLPLRTSAPSAAQHLLLERTDEAIALIIEQVCRETNFAALTTALREMLGDSTEGRVRVWEVLSRTLLSGNGTDADLENDINLLEYTSLWAAPKDIAAAHQGIGARLARR